MGARLCTYYQKSAPGDQKGSLMRNENSGLGSVIVLDPADKSPFLGDIKPGCTQSSLETNMYRAPIYQQKVSSTDYLLVRSAKGKLSIRRIDRIDVVGQQVRMKKFQILFSSSVLEIYIIYIFPRNFWCSYKLIFCSILIQCLWSLISVSLSPATPVKCTSDLSLCLQGIMF